MNKLTKAELTALNSIINFNEKNSKKNKTVLVVNSNVEIDCYDLANRIHASAPLIIAIPNQPKKISHSLSDELVAIQDSRPLGELIDGLKTIGIEPSCTVINYDDLDTVARHLMLSPKLKSTPMAVVHGIDGREVPQLLKLYAFGSKQVAGHLCETTNGKPTYSDQAAVTYWTNQMVRPKPLKNKYEEEIIKISNSGYFVKGYAQFGLHTQVSINDNLEKVIIFDYDFAYSPIKNQIYKLNEKGAFELVHSLDKSKITLLRKSLLNRKFYPADHANPIIKIDDKIVAAQLREHLHEFTEINNAIFTDMAAQATEDFEPENPGAYYAAAFNFVSFPHPLRFTSEFDRIAYEEFHSSITRFTRLAQQAYRMFLAKDHRGNHLIFEIASRDDCHHLLQQFLSGRSDLVFPLKLTDCQSYTLLDRAVEAKALRNKALLIAHGMDMDTKNALGFCPRDKE